MSFSNIIKRKSRLLLPFSWLYKTGVALHNKIYEWGFKKTTSPNLPLICVGNLSVGGTGKTPMVEYLLRLITPHYKTATISRGYKRQSSGVFIANETTTVFDIGDEPMQFHTKFPEAKIVVGEKRVQAFDELIQWFPETEVVILDDAFQHRAIQAGLNILLTEYDNLFTDDYYLPAGQLRDVKINYKRADIIVVTKCSDSMDLKQKNKITSKIKPFSHQVVFFTTIKYDAPYHFINQNHTDFTNISEIILVTGIANPQPLIHYLQKYNIILHKRIFGDHHIFTIQDIESVEKKFQQLKPGNNIILTTEKDAMRLIPYKDELKRLPLYVIPVSHSFLFNGSDKFNDRVMDFIQRFNVEE